MLISCEMDIVVNTEKVIDRPISIVEYEGFKYLIKTVSPNFKIPCQRYISRKIYEKYDIMKEIVMTKLKNIQHFSLTTYIWTGNQTRSLVTLVLLFILLKNIH